ncbi:hypothetical protein HDV06_001011 [Boothiomyces sp. JEL0866]|nr:hypothetical protein HDV06_001011 [Boothiomyces sp. JEL0866]
MILAITLPLVSALSVKRDISFQPYYGGILGSDCDFPGNDISLGVKVYGITQPSDCIILCERYSGCTHYTFTPGLCNIKSGTVQESNAVSASGAQCGILPANHPSWNTGKGGNLFGTNCNFPEESIGSTSNVPSYGYCYLDCRANPNCTHYTLSSGTCYFYNGKSSILNAAYAGGEQCGILAGHY